MKEVLTKKIQSKIIYILLIFIIKTQYYIYTC